MAIVKRWIEVEDECLGPDKKNNHWEMFLIMHLCTEYNRKTKRGLQTFIRRGKTVKSIIGKLKKDVLSQVEEYLAQPEVFLLTSKP